MKDSIEDVRFWNPVEEIDNKLENPDRRVEFYKADFISTISKARSLNVDSLPEAYVDSVRQVVNHYMRHESEQFTAQGLQLKQQRDSITSGIRPFRIAYAEEHPMLWTLYDVLDAIQALKHADNYVNFNKSQFEPYLTLYHDKLINYYPGHPVHEQIATTETAYRLQPGKPYIDYMVRNTDGHLVPISTLTKETLHRLHSAQHRRPSRSYYHPHERQGSPHRSLGIMVRSLPSPQHRHDSRL